MTLGVSVFVQLCWQWYVISGHMYVHAHAQTQTLGWGP